MELIKNFWTGLWYLTKYLFGPSALILAGTWLFPQVDWVGAAIVVYVLLLFGMICAGIGRDIRGAKKP